MLVEGGGEGRGTCLNCVPVLAGAKRGRLFARTLPPPEEEEGQGARRAQERVLVSHHTRILGLPRPDHLALRKATLDDATGRRALGGIELEERKVGQFKPAMVLSAEDHLVRGQTVEVGSEPL